MNMEPWLCRVINVVGITLPLIFICLLILSIFNIVDYVKEYKNTYDKSLTNKSFALFVTWIIVAVISLIGAIAIPIGLFVSFPNIW